MSPARLRTTATVTQVVAFPMPFSEGLVAAVLDIAFTTADGSRVTTTLPFGHATPPAEGALIEILYDLEQPENVEPVDGPDSVRSPAPLGPPRALTREQTRHLLLGIGGVVILFGVLTALGRDPFRVVTALLVAAAFAGVVLFHRNRRRQVREHGVRVQGVVLGFQRRYVNGRRYRRPVVSFTADGQEITAELSSFDPELMRGQRIALAYDPARPERVVPESTLTDGNGGDRALMAFGALCAGAGYYLFDGALIRLRRRPKNRLPTIAALILGPTLIATGALLTFVF